ncbi:hypothetical protein GJ496_011694 [Pomphorhynchus laevis]|nr:hypothetical protein GJ496_011694 [Pomphorhynchus laevis]
MPKMHSTGSKDNTLSKSTKPDKRGRVLSKDPSISTDVKYCDIQIAYYSAGCDLWAMMSFRKDVFQTQMVDSSADSALSAKYKHLKVFANYWN